jgi:hypothetical protein
MWSIASIEQPEVIDKILSHLDRCPAPAHSLPVREHPLLSSL